MPGFIKEQIVAWKGEIEAEEKGEGGENKKD